MPISCEQYDYIEIACLFHYSVTVYLNNGNLIEGKAFTTRINQLREEELVLSVNDQQLNVRIDDVDRLQVTTPNAKFSQIVLSHN